MAIVTSFGAGHPTDRDDCELARQCINSLSAARADDRESWIKVGMAAKAVSESLFADWETWGAKSSKFKPGECAKLWEGFANDKAQSLGAGSLVRWAREDSGDQSIDKSAAPANPRRLGFKTLDQAVQFAAGSLGPVAKVWPYPSAAGTTKYWIARFDLSGTDGNGKPKKTFRPFRLVGDRYLMGDPEGLLPLYGLAELAAATEPFVGEGEKAADAARAVGFTATTSAHGAQSSGRSDWSPLAGKVVYLLPDNDANGSKYVLAVGAILQKLDPPASVRVLTLPSLPIGGDIADFVAQRAHKTPEETRAEIEIHKRVSVETLAQYAARCAGLDGSAQSTNFRSSGSAGFGGGGGALKRACEDVVGGGSAGLDGGLPRAFPSFGERIPLPSDRPPVAPFDFDFLPRTLVPWVRDVVERMQCPPDFFFVAAIVECSMLIGRKVGIRPKRHDNWLVVVNLWGAGVGRPSIMKTPAMQEAMKPVRKLELKSKREFEEESRKRHAAQFIETEKQKILKESLRDAVREESPDVERIANELAGPLVQPPTRRRRLVNDSTVEKLGELLADNPNGLLVYRDELVSQLHSLDREGQESARGFYLQAWNGDGSYTYDRIGRGTVEIPSAIVSMLGSIQPGPFDQYLRAAGAGGKGDDGLVQRFQLTVYPDIPKTWENHDRAPDAEARDIAYQVFEILDELEAGDVQAETDPYEPDGIPFLRFDDAAQDLFDDWRTQFEARLRSGEEEEIFEAHLAKYRSLIPSLALIIHIVDGGVGPVGIDSLRRAIATARYLESHARRLYASAIFPEAAAAKALVSRIRKGEVRERFTLRDIYQKGWAKLTTALDVERAVALLIEHGWLIPQQARQAVGASKTIHLIHPDLLAEAVTGHGTGTTSTTDSDNAPETAETRSEGTVRTSTTASDAAETANRGAECTGTTGTTPPTPHDAGRTSTTPVGSAEQTDFGFAAGAEEAWL